MSYVGYWYITMHFFFFIHPTSIKLSISLTVGNRLLKPLRGKMLDWLNFRLGEITVLIYMPSMWDPLKWQQNTEYMRAWMGMFGHVILINDFFALNYNDFWLNAWYLAKCLLISDFQNPPSRPLYINIESKQSSTYSRQRPFKISTTYRKTFTLL